VRGELKLVIDAVALRFVVVIVAAHYLGKACSGDSSASKLKEISTVNVFVHFGRFLVIVFVVVKFNDKNEKLRHHQMTYFFWGVNPP
jgi:hypothetical protein